MTTSKKVRAAGYIRVSTDEQVRDGYGLVYQAEKVKSFAASQDYVLEERHVFKDEGYSGSLAVDSRPALKRLMEAAGRREFDIILVYKLDRLARKLLIVLDTVQKLGEFNVGFRSITEPFDTSNHFGRYLLANLGGLAELERETIKERTNAGRIAAAKAGKWVTGMPPYGYKLDKKTGKLVVIPDEVANIKKFFGWLVDEKLSLHQITIRANDLRIPTRSKKLKFKKKTSGYWQKKTINRILVNETYTGVAPYRKYKFHGRSVSSEFSDANLRPQEEWIYIPVPPIISQETFNAALAQLKHNYEFSRRNQKRTYLFSKKIYCGYCGFKLFAAFSPPLKEGNTGHRYYRGVLRQKYVVEGKRCKTCGQTGETRLYPIWDTLKQILHNPQNLIEMIRATASSDNSKKAVVERLPQIDEQIKSVEMKKRKLVNVYLEDHAIDDSMYKKRLWELEKEAKDLELEKLRLNQMLMTRGERTEREQAIGKLYSKVKKMIENVSYEQKAKLINIFIDKTILYRHENVADVVFNFPQERYAAAYGSAVLKDSVAQYSSMCLWDNNRR